MLWRPDARLSLRGVWSPTEMRSELSEPSSVIGNVTPFAARGLIKDRYQFPALRVDEALLRRHPVWPWAASRHGLVSPGLDDEAEQQHEPGDGQTQDRAERATGNRRQPRCGQQEAGNNV